MTPASQLQRIASIVPTAHLNETIDDQYFMALDHLCDDDVYMSFFKARIAEGKFVILDNSTVELGEPVDPEVYLVDAKLMGASQVLCPDWLYEADRTIESSRDFVKRAKRMHYKGSIMGAPQGKDDNEWLDCARRMLEMPEITCLGVSRRYTNFWSQRRLSAVQGLRQLCEATYREEVTIHLLGCHDRPEWDVAPSLTLPYVQGVDSSLAALFTMNGIVITEGAERLPGSIDFSHSYRLGLLRENLRRWKLLCARGTLSGTSQKANLR